MQGIGERVPRLPLAGGLHQAGKYSGTAPNDLRPQRNIGTPDIAPQDIEPFVPIIEFLIIVALKTRTAEPEHLQVIAELSPNDRRRYVSGVWNSIGRREFTAQGSRVRTYSHVM
jgi:hypothetical protein